MSYHEELKGLIHEYIKFVYRITKDFPVEERYGVSSQFRRAAMSVMLNYVEGYARRKGSGCKVYKNFLETSFGSLKESKYLLYFSFDIGYINEKVYKEGLQKAERIGKMLGE